MPVDARFIRALTEISPDLAKQYLRQYHPTEALEEVLEPMPPEPEAKPASTVEERNTDLFFEIADVLDFYPHLYNQRTYGEFLIPDGTGHPLSQGSTVVPDLSLVEVRGCATTACLAGWAAALSGWHPTTHTTVGSNDDIALLGPCRSGTADYVKPPLRRIGLRPGSGTARNHRPGSRRTVLRYALRVLRETPVDGRRPQSHRQGTVGVHKQVARLIFE